MLFLAGLKFILGALIGFPIFDFVFSKLLINEAFDLDIFADTPLTDLLIDSACFLFYLQRC